MRPERIIKLMNYISDKEPLIYLFLVNSDFIEDDGKLLGSSPAGVTYKDKRVLFIYNPQSLSEMSKEELYFLVIHEAFHILKKHLSRHKDISKIDFLLANISEDAVINHEIIKSKFYYELKPVMPEYGVLPNMSFLNEYYNLGDSAIETYRIFYWYLRESKKENYVNPKGLYLDKENNNLVYKEKEYDDGTSEVIDKKNKEKYTTKTENLVPVNSTSGDRFLPSKSDKYRLVEFDKHFDKEEQQEENSSEFEKIKEEIERNNFIDNLIEQAERLEKKIRDTRPGSAVGNLVTRIKELNKPVVNWRKETRKHIHKFITQNSYLKNKKKSHINYAWDPKSNYGILGKYNIETTDKITNYIIFAIDTSGSCFGNTSEMKAFFSELDGAAKELEFSRTGKILTIQWDYTIQEELKEYKKDAWKKFDIKGGGGTSPKIVFSYIDKMFEDVGDRYKVKYNNSIFFTQNKKELPLLVFLTDGYFNELNLDNLGIYKQNPKNVLWITRTEKSVFPKENFIKYSWLKIYKII